MVGRPLDCTCLQGLELALKWAPRACDAELARSTAGIVHDCAHRRDCRRSTECSRRLDELENWLSHHEAAQESIPPLSLGPRPT